MQLTFKDIENLILIGNTQQAELFEFKNHILQFKQRDFINRLHRQTWRQKAEHLSDIDLVFLFKGLVIVEREIKWSGGSVAGAIWIYRIIQERRLDKEFEIADFALKNCDNPWIPFGDSYYGKRTVKDYFNYQEKKARISQEKAERYNKVLKRVEGRKKKRIAAIAELRSLDKKTRGQIRKELLDKYVNASTKEKLVLIANDEKYPPEYYPTEWIIIPTTEIDSLPMDLIKRLYDKLSTKTKGPWKRFAAEILKYDDGM